MSKSATPDPICGRPVKAHNRRSSYHDNRGLIREIRAITLAARTGLKDHARWLQARQQMEHRLKGSRSTSSLPDWQNSCW